MPRGQYLLVSLASTALQIEAAHESPSLWTSDSFRGQSQNKQDVPAAGLHTHVACLVCAREKTMFGASRMGLIGLGRIRPPHHVV